jgi:acylphosphatase
MQAPSQSARRWLIRGHVQGVGYRYFARSSAASLHLTGYTLNLDDGRVEVYAAGPPAALDALAGLLRQGPRFSEVRGVEEQEAEVHHHAGFHIR